MFTIAEDIGAAVRAVRDGDTIAVSGFGLAGQPTELIDALIETGTTDLTIVANNAGNGDTGLAKLLAQGSVRKVVCSFPRQSDSHVFDQLYRDGRIELELVPQGTLAERLRAAGAGIGGFYTRTTLGTPLAEGKEHRMIGGVEFVLENALPVSVALVKAHRADRFGNLTYRKTARNFGPVMAMAAAHTIAQVSSIKRDAGLNPENIVTPSIFVDTIVEVGNATA